METNEIIGYTVVLIIVIGISIGIYFAVTGGNNFIPTPIYSSSKTIGESIPKTNPETIPRPEHKQETRPEHKQEARQEKKQEARQEQETRQKYRQESYQEKKQESYQEKKQEARQEKKQEYHQEYIAPPIPLPEIEIRVPPQQYTCAGYTTAETVAINAGTMTQLSACVAGGNLYTGGINSNAPGCGTCFCCRQVPKIPSELPSVQQQYTCAGYTTAETNAINAGTITQQQVCVNSGNVYTGGNNVNTPGCGTCWCCKKNVYSPTTSETTASGTKYTISSNPSCRTVASEAQFLVNNNGNWVPMSRDQAIDTCRNQSNLGGYGKCLGIVTAGNGTYEGCISVSNNVGSESYLLSV